MPPKAGKGIVSRWLSALLAVVYVGIGFAGGPSVGIKTACFFLLPLCCIWFPDAMGRYTNY
jgi:hypothetical protein